MRSSYPLTSAELNDKFLTAYENLVYLLGYQENNENSYSGLFDQFDDTIDSILLSVSGIPGYGMPRTIDFLKYDYIYKKHYGEIQYLENING